MSTNVSIVAECSTLHVSPSSIPLYGPATQQNRTFLNLAPASTSRFFFTAKTAMFLEDAATMRLFFVPLILTPMFVSAAERACNNSPNLCNVGYDRVTHLGAHDSPFLHDASTGFSTFGNQFFDTITQLDAGVRLLTAQVHADTDPVTKARQLRVCHTSCRFMDAGSFSDWLWRIRIWLDRNPNDVVTLVLVNYHFVSAGEFEADYSKADIAHYGYVPPKINGPPPPSNQSHNTWPTLGEMVDKGERLVTFINVLLHDKENSPYLVNEFDFLWENAYDVASPAAFACTPDRPSNTTTIAEMRASGRLFLMNHMLYVHQAFGIITPNIKRIDDTNSWNGPGGLGAHMTKCASEIARQPTFVLVDYFNVGPAIQSVDVFNKVKAPVGRKNVTTESLEGGSGSKRTSGSKEGAPGALVAIVIALVVAVFLC